MAKKYAAILLSKNEKELIVMTEGVDFEPKLVTSETNAKKIMGSLGWDDNWILFGLVDDPTPYFKALHNGKEKL